MGEFFSVLFGELERARQPSVASQWGRGCSGARRFFTSEVAQPSGLRSGSSQRVCGRVFFRACVAPGARHDTRMFGHHRPPPLVVPYSRFLVFMARVRVQVGVCVCIICCALCARACAGARVRGAQRVH